MASSESSNKQRQTGVAEAIEDFHRRWLAGHRPEIQDFVNAYGALCVRDLTLLLRADQQAAWDAGDARPSEFYLERFPVLETDPECCVDLIYGEYLLTEACGGSPDIADFAARFPQFATILHQQVQLHRAISGNFGDLFEFAAESDRDFEHTLFMEGSLADSSQPRDSDRSLSGPSAQWPTLPGYEILRRLGRGGSSVVYEARDLRLNRLVAIKMLIAGDSASADSVRRLQAEAEAVARLQHPNIVRIHQVGDCNGRVYLILEHVNGGTLAEHSAGQPQSPQQAAALVETLSRAIHVAHQKGIIHRDLKPANVLLESDGNSDSEAGESSRVPRVADFGLAKLLQPSSENVLSTVDRMGEPTRVGDILGTPSYMAPEQARGDNSSVGPAVDIHALGAILYEQLTGRPPYQGLNSFDILKQVVMNDPIPPHRLIPRIPFDLETICLKCLQKLPAQRYATALELADDLKRFLDGQPIRARRISLLHKAGKWMRRHPGAVAAAACLILLAAGGIAGVVSHYRQLRLVRLQAIVSSLATAAPAAVATLTSELADHHHESQPILQQAVFEVPFQSGAWLNLRQAQLIHDPSVALELADFARLVEPESIHLLKTALRPFREIVRDRLWFNLLSEAIPAAERIRLACMLADAATLEDPRWHAVSEALANQLVRENPLHASRWALELKPVGRILVPKLEAICRQQGRSSTERFLAASILANQNSEDSHRLTQLLLDSTPDQYAVLLPAVGREQAVMHLQQAALHTLQISRNDSAQLPGRQTPTELLKKQKEQHRRRAVAALTLAHLGHPQALETLMGSKSDDPTACSYAIHLAAQLQLPPQWFVDYWQRNPSAGSRQAALLALGQYDQRAFPEVQRQNFGAQLEADYLSDPDAGVHSAIHWILQRWNFTIESLTSEQWRTEPKGRRWFVNRQGQTYAVLPAAAPILGSPDTEEDHEPDEILRSSTIPLPFAIACCEVTVGDYLKFRPDAWVNRKYNPEPNCPMGDLSWFDAAAYCRWLSEQEGIPESEMCFPAVEDIKPGMVLPLDVLSRTGYRMPIEAEWEYACRAGTNTSWSFGMASDLIGLASRCLDNSGDRTGPVGILLPNSFGLFDMHGNVSEWCVDDGTNYHQPGSGEHHMGEIDSRPRVVRGGSFGVRPLTQRSARRARQPPGERWAVTGLRPVRTMPHTASRVPPESVRERADSGFPH